MELSGGLLKTTSFVLDTLFKVTNADIRTHGEESIPDQPAVYVINHFTRMETFFLPYIIHKVTGKTVLSLAFHGFFGGGFGRFLEKLGAVSTNDPDRDNIMIGSLLRNEYPCLIYPEGQMVKDKKIIEKGKYMIFNAGIRRPPHTGSALLALRAEFYRRKLKYFLETGFQKGIEEYRRCFGMTSEDLPKISRNETVIIPVNITYFPIRARNNAINRIAKRFVENMPDRLDEELEVEGSMVIDGVDIDVNFGRAIPVRSYLEGATAGKMIGNNRLYLAKNEVKEELSFRKERIDLMYRYMNDIYGMTTVNHDHIFSYLLSSSHRKRIPEERLKNRAYLAINSLKQFDDLRCHTSLMKKQEYLLSDDFHERYESFLKAAESDGLIRRGNGCIYRDGKKFSKPYEFHTIRRDNIVEVLKNELEPLGNVVRACRRTLYMPDWLMRRRLRKEFLERDREIFERDYGQYFIEGESKPKNIGSPFFLRKTFSRKGVLLMHGYMAAPEEIRLLAEFLHGRGYTVYAPRLRGHGTAPEDLAGRTWDEWYDSVNRGYIVLKNSVRKMIIGGFSTGAGLAILQAVRKPGRFMGVFSINAPLKIKNIASRLATAVVFWNNFLKKVRMKKGAMEFVRNNPENPHINYFRNPVRGVQQLEKLMNQVEDALRSLDTPLLVIQGSNDPVVNPVSSQEIFERAGVRDKELFTVFASRHGIVRGEGSDRVFEKAESFLRDKFSRRL